MRRRTSAISLRRNHDGDDRVHAGLIVRPRSVSASAEELCVFLKLVAQFGRCAEKLRALSARGDNRGAIVLEIIWANVAV